MKKSLGIALLLTLLWLVVHVSADRDSLSAIDKRQQSTTLEIIDHLNNRHYSDIELDDQLSVRFLNNYYDMLDPNKSYFLQSDIDEFTIYEHQLDELLKKGDNSAGFIIYERYRQRLTERLTKVIALLESDTTFDFTRDESLIINRQDLGWLRNQAEADDLWRKQIKSSLLAQKLSGESVQDARQKLIKRYKNQLNRVKKLDANDIYSLFINAFTRLYDPHTNFLAPRASKNFNINMSLSLEGIGAVLQTEDEYTKVVRLVTGGPAQKQGELRPADHIIGVAQGDDSEMVDVIGWPLDEVVDLIRGPKNTIVRLQVIANGGVGEVAKIISIKREKVDLEDQAAQKAVFEVDSGNHPFKIGVIDVPTFYLDFEAQRKGDPSYRSTTRDVVQLLAELEKEQVDGIILDLGDNGGGSLQEATALTDLFIHKGPVVQIRQGKKGQSRRMSTRAQTKERYRGPLLVLINRLSASASEIFAGAIQDYRRGIVVGSQSFGKGTVQSLANLGDYGQLKITESKFYRVSGDSTQHRGVIPDILMPELIDPDEVGESSYDTALPWGEIQPATHTKYAALDKVISQLIMNHENRIKANPDFIHINEQKKLLERYDSENSISLNKSKRLEEKKDRELTSLALENTRRIAKNLTPHKTIEEYKQYTEEKIEQQQMNSNVTTIDLDEDPILMEAGFILKDFVEISSSNNSYKMANTQ